MRCVQKGKQIYVGEFRATVIKNQNSAVRHLWSLLFSHTEFAIPGQGLSWSCCNRPCGGNRQWQNPFHAGELNAEVQHQVDFYQLSKDVDPLLLVNRQNCYKICHSIDSTILCCWIGCLDGDSVTLSRHIDVSRVTPKAVAWPQGYSERTEEVAKNPK